jgi:signal transduction histidine kinase/ligand-binding sensor domain-containing protein
MTNVPARISFVISLLFFAAIVKKFNPCFAQQEKPAFEHLTRANGLSSNSVTDILQDRDGFYWIATTDGLNRFDGSSFKVFKHNKNDSTSISNSHCIKLLEDREGDIWVATIRGVCCYKKKQGVFKRYFFHHPPMNDNILNVIFSFDIDERGHIWVSSRGIWEIDPVTDNIIPHLYREGDNTGISDNSPVFNLLYDRAAKGFWLSTEKALNFYDIHSGKFFHHQHNPLQWPVFQRSNKRPLHTINKGMIWFYERKEAQLFNVETASKTYSSIKLPFPNTVSAFSTDGDSSLVFNFELLPSRVFKPGNNNIDSLRDITDTVSDPPVPSNCIFKDRYKNKWFCTNDGLYISPYRPNRAKVFSLGKDEKGTPRNIYSIVKYQHSLWLNVQNKLYRYDYVKQQSLPVPPGISLPLYNAGDSILWATDYKNIIRVRLKDQQVISKTPIDCDPYFLLADKQKHFWVGSWNNGLYEFDEKGTLLNHFSEKDGLPYKYLNCGWYDGDHEIWLGMNGGKGFARFDIQTKKFESFLITSKNKTIIESNTVGAIVKDKMGNLWLGTRDGGLYYYDRKADQFYNYQQSDGLSGDFINTLAFDRTGNLWISTMNGIDIMDVTTKNIRHVNEDMQQHNTDHVNNLAIGDDGTFFYTCKNRIAMIQPLHYTESFPEAVVVKSGFKVYDRDMPQLLDDSLIRLPYRQNFFSIEFSALKISPNIPAQYAYKLEGFNADWNYSYGRGFANYTNVPPGHYTLLLNATNETGKWNDRPLRILMIIRPPFWKTWWFYLCATALLATAFLLITRNRIRQIKKREQDQLRLVVATQEREKKNISAELHDDLGVRLSALKYFVTSLKPYLSSDNPQAGDTYNKTIATIDESVEDVRYLLINLSPKTLNEYGYLAAVEDLVNKLGRLHVIHISLQQQGMEKRLDPDTEAGLYRITQELINNTLKHANASTIHLSIDRSAGSIQLQYADDGKGFDPYGKTEGYGIDNIHTRIALLDGKIEWDRGAEKSTKVNIVIPYNHT